MPFFFSSDSDFSPFISFSIASLHFTPFLIFCPMNPLILFVSLFPHSYRFILPTCTLSILSLPVTCSYSISFPFTLSSSLPLSVTPFPFSLFQSFSHSFCHSISLPTFFSPFPFYFKLLSTSLPLILTFLLSSSSISLYITFYPFSPSLVFITLSHCLFSYSFSFQLFLSHSLPSPSFTSTTLWI